MSGSPASAARHRSRSGPTGPRGPSQLALMRRCRCADLRVLARRRRAGLQGGAGSPQEWAIPRFGAMSGAFSIDRHGSRVGGRPRSAGLSDRQAPGVGRPATGTIPAGRCGFPAILLTSRDPDVTRSSGSAGWRRASRPAVEPLSRLFASMGDIRDSGWISHISSINGQFAIYDVRCAFCNRRRSIQDYV